MFWRSGSARDSDSHVLRPMITAWPAVSARNLLRSSVSRQGSRLPTPMTPFAATAAISAIAGFVTVGDPWDSRGRFWTGGVGAAGRGVIIAANYSGPSRVLPPLLSQIHPAGIPAGNAPARLCARRADPLARSIADAGARGRAAGGAGRAREP